MKIKFRVSILTFALLLVFGASAMAQEAQAPTFAQSSARPNVILVIDTSGSMGWSGESGVSNPRSRMEIVRDVLTGSGKSTVKDDSGNIVYMPNQSHDTSENISILKHLSDAMIKVVRVSPDWGEYEPDANGQYFAFQNPEDVSRNRSNVSDATVTINELMIELGEVCISKVEVEEVNPDGQSDSRTIWETTSVCAGDSVYDLSDIYQRWFYFSQTGTIAGEGNEGLVVPVYYVRRDRRGTWYNPHDFPALNPIANDGVCRWTGSRFRDCWLIAIAEWTDKFVMYDDIKGAGNRDLVELRKMTIADWATVRESVTGNYPEAYRARYYDQIVGDVPGTDPLNDWTWIGGDRYYEDGNTSRYDIYEAAWSTNWGAIDILPPMPSEDDIKQSFLDTLPNILEVDEYGDDGTGPEFILGSGTTRLDEKLRSEVGLPATLTLADMDLDDPFFSEFFSQTLTSGTEVWLSYDSVGYEALGIMDIYSEVNYGIMGFDNSSYCTSDGTDFPGGGTDDCMGADLLKNSGTMYEFAANTAYTPTEYNEYLQTYIDTNIGSGGDLRPTGCTPIASAVHDAARYFWEHDMGSYVPTPSPYVDLGFPDPSGSANDHVFQGDSFYTEGCRRNYFIFLTDGEQTCGDPGSSRLSTIIAQQEEYVELLRDGPNSTSTPSKNGVKSFFIGFNLGDADGKAQLDAMAAASYMPDLTGPEAEDDVRDPLFADEPDELMSSFTFIMNSIMSGSYARVAPEYSASENIFVTSYFDITEYPLWTGHLEVWNVPDLGDDVATPYWSSENDIGVILDDSSEGSRNIYVGMGTSPVLREFEENSPYITDSVMDPDGTWSGEVDISGKTIKVIRGTSDAKFKNGVAVDWKLGPNFHSRPRILSAPSSSEYSGMTGYRDFMTAHADRGNLLAVGSGYGLLHFFNLSKSSRGGEEIFAYMPESLLRYLPYLYEGTQLAGWDSTPVIDDAWGDFGSGKEWGTIIISGLGDGGTAYPVLNVTDADSLYNTGDIEPLYHFTDENLGFTKSVPVMGLINLNGAIETAAFFGGGVSNSDSTYNIGGYFYVIKLDDGTILKKFDLPDYHLVGGDLSTVPSLSSGDTNSNEVASAPVIIDWDKDGLYDWAYVGDDDGRIWKFNFHSENPDDWEACIFYDVTDENINQSIADNSSSDDDRRKPLQYSPALALGPNNSLLVYFSSGGVEEVETAAEEAKSNFLFALMDPDAMDDMNQCSYGVEIPGELTGSSVTNWPMEFTDYAEKVITQPLISQGYIIFKTYLPETTVACAAGTVRLYILDYLTGSAVWDFDGDGTTEAYLEDPNLSTGEVVIDKAGRIWDATPPGEGGGGPGPNVIEDLGLEGADPSSWGEVINH